MPTPDRPNRLTRRHLLQRGALLGAGLVVAPSILAACGGDDDSAGTATTAAGGSGSSTGGKSLFFENWPAYIDPETVDLFKKQTGIDFKYTEAFNDNNEYFAKVQPELSAGKRIDPDILAPTNWMAGRFIKLGWAQKLPMDQIPNAKNLRKDLQKPAIDPGAEYTLPWQTGIAGIAYNLKATGREVKSVNDLFDPAFKGKVGMLTEMRDTVGLTLLAVGKDPSTVKTFDDASAAFDKLEKAKSDGQIRQFTGNDYLDDLSAGNFAVCVGWSGDVLQLQKDNPDVRFVVPEEGGMSWWDTMLLIKGSPNGAAAAAFMDYVYDPVNAARITATVQYVSPVEGVQAELEKLDPELAKNPLLFPDAATVAKLKVFALLSEDEETKFDEAFAKLTGA